MTNIVAAQVGSGTVPFVRGILPAAQRGSEPLGEGIRTGVQVMVGNPEDLVSVDAFAASGITVGGTPLKIFGSSSGTWPRARRILVQNATDSSTLLVANTAAKTAEGWQLVNGTNAPRAFVELPIMAGVDVWVAALSGSILVRTLIF